MGLHRVGHDGSDVAAAAHKQYVALLVLHHQVALVVKKKKNPPAKAGDMKEVGQIPGWGRSRGGYGNPSQYSCLKNPSLVGYSAWGHKSQT